MAQKYTPYVKRCGRYFYFRTKVSGRYIYHRLPDIADGGFEAAYRALLRSEEQRRSLGDGTLRALLADYRISPQYRNLRPASKRLHSRYAEFLAERFDDRKVAEITTPDVVRLQSELHQTPGSANVAIAQLSTLLRFGIQLGYCERNVAAGLRRFKTGEHEPWPTHVLKAALAAAAPMDRLAIVTGLATGQRIGDCIKIRHVDISGNMLELVQQKTGKKVHVPIHPIWRAELARVPKRAVTILYNHHGRPFRTPDTLQGRIRALMKSIGHEGYSFHGLRKNATNRLAHLGLTHHEIGAITGMSIQTIEHYTRSVNSALMARRVSDRVTSGHAI